MTHRLMPSAVADLEGIWYYVASEGGSPGARRRPTPDRAAAERLGLGRGRTDEQQRRLLDFLEWAGEALLQATAAPSLLPASQRD